MKRSLNSQRNDRGVVALELVLALPVLLMLIIGAVILGNFMSVNAQAVNFAREGARDAALGNDLPADTDKVTYVFDGPCPDVRDPENEADVTVEATMPLNLRTIPFLPTFLPETISRRVTMRCGG